MNILDRLIKGLGLTPARDGKSPETAVLVASVAAEYAWLRQHCPGLTPENQYLTEIDGRYFDILRLTRDSDGGERDVYFDISSFLLPGGPPGDTGDAPALVSGGNAFPLMRSAIRHESTPSALLAPWTPRIDRLVHCSRAAFW